MSDHTTEGDPTLDEVIAVYARQAIYEGDGPMLAEVLSYDAAKQTAIVQPLFHVWRGESFRRLPGFEVPVAWPRGDQFALTFPLSPGVIVQLVAQTQDSSPHRSGSKDVAPPTKRRNQVTDSVALPLGATPAAPLPSSAVAADGLVIWATPFVYLGGSTATDFVALASKVAAELSTIAGLYNSHVHTTPSGPSGPPGTPPTGLPTHTYTPGSVGSTVVKSL